MILEYKVHSFVSRHSIISCSTVNSLRKTDQTDKEQNNHRKSIGMDTKKCDCEITSLVEKICKSIENVRQEVEFRAIDAETTLKIRYIEESTAKMEELMTKNSVEIAEIVEKSTEKIINAIEKNTKAVTKAIEKLAHAIRDLKNS